MKFRGLNNYVKKNRAFPNISFYCTIIKKGLSS